MTDSLVEVSFENDFIATTTLAISLLLKGQKEVDDVVFSSILERVIDITEKGFTFPNVSVSDFIDVGPYRFSKDFIGIKLESAIGGSNFIPMFTFSNKVSKESRESLINYLLHTIMGKNFKLSTEEKVASIIPSSQEEDIPVIFKGLEPSSVISSEEIRATIVDLFKVNSSRPEVTSFIERFIIFLKKEGYKSIGVTALLNSWNTLKNVVNLSPENPEAVIFYSDGPSSASVESVAIRNIKKLEAEVNNKDLLYKIAEIGVPVEVPSVQKVPTNSTRYSDLSKVFKNVIGLVKRARQ